MSEATDVTLVAAWDAWAEAIASNDPERIGSFMTADWIITGANGSASKVDFLGWVMSGDLTHEAMNRVGDPRIRVYGDAAVLTVRVTNNGHYRGQPFSADEWTTDMYVRRAGEWLCVASHITAVQTP